MTLLHISGLDKSFYDTHAVNNVSFDIHEGEIVALMGENGAGKSTVIKMLAGIYQPDAGCMELLGRPITCNDAKHDVAFIHQNLGLIDWMTVAENIAITTGFPRTGPFISEGRLNEQAEEVLALVGGGINPKTRIFDLARGERSLLVIARALVKEPKLLVLDEPTASLPEEDVQLVFEVLRRLRSQGTGMIYVTHRLDEVKQITDRCLVMRNGQLVADKPSAELSHKELVTLIVGGETKNVCFKAPTKEVSLEMKDVSFGAVGPLNMQLHKGEIIGLCGLRGAGQMAVGRVLGGVYSATKGDIVIDDIKCRFTKPIDAIRKSIAFVTSNRETEAILPGVTVRENLCINPKLWGHVFYRHINERKEIKLAHVVCKKFSVRPLNTELFADTLSGGNQQKVILARWLHLGYKNIILEEPTMGVDIGAKTEIYGFLCDAASRGASIVVTSTDLEEISKICHRAIVFRNGKVYKEFLGSEITTTNLMAAASGLDISTKKE